MIPALFWAGITNMFRYNSRAVSLITNFKFQISNYELRVTSYEFNSRHEHAGITIRVLDARSFQKLLTFKFTFSTFNFQLSTFNFQLSTF